MLQIITPNGGVFRPAGYRQPLTGEQYVAKDGKVKLYTGVGQPGLDFGGVRLIVRCYNCGIAGCQGKHRPVESK